MDCLIYCTRNGINTDAYFYQEEDEFPDDETINQMLARTEDEFETYQVWTYVFNNLLSLFPNRCHNKKQLLSVAYVARVVPNQVIYSLNTLFC